jgi:hypothetical protein
MKKHNIKTFGSKKKLWDYFALHKTPYKINILSEDQLRVEEKVDYDLTFDREFLRQFADPKHYNKAQMLLLQTLWSNLRNVKENYEET